MSLTKSMRRVLALVLGILVLGCSIILVPQAAAQKGAFSNTMPNQSGDPRAFSYLSSLVSDDYISDMIRADVENWQLEALAKNPGIIEKIRDHQSGLAINLSALINDGWGMIQNNKLSLSAKDRYSEFGNAIEWKQLSPDAVYDLDVAFGRQSGSVVDWRDQKYLWLYMDVSQFGINEVPFGIAFEEYDVDGGALGSNRESWAVKTGASVTLHPKNGTSSSVKAVASASDPSRGRIVLPAKFVGWVQIPLNTTTFYAYWNYPTGNGKLDLMDVHQLQVTLQPTATSQDGKAYFGGFVLSKETDKAPTAQTLSVGYTTFWNLNVLEAETADSTNSWMIEAAWAWYGEYPGKLLTGISASYQMYPSAELKAAGDKLVAELKSVQKSDGYLGTFDSAQRFGAGGANWDVWNHYHIIYGLYQWYTVTGNADALPIATRAADCVINHFSQKSNGYVAAGSPQMNFAIGHAFATLYRATGEKKYVDEAEKIVNRYWPADIAGDWLNEIEAGKEFYQMTGGSGNPYNNRWEALHALMTLGTLGEVTGNNRYIKAYEALWESIRKTDRHNSGSFSVGEGAVGDPFRSGGIETCCSIAWMAMTTEYLQLSRNAVAADELELSYYNTMMASFMEDKRLVTYNTPMNGSLVSAKDELGWFQGRHNSPDFSCCQANSARGIGELAQWAVLTDDVGLYWNYYGNANITTKTPGGQEIGIKQTGGYPQNGKITLSIDKLAKEENFALSFRVPSWATSFRVTVGGKVYSADKTAVYMPISGTWSKGTTVTVDIGMSFHFWKGSGECAGQVSVYYGPVLLAADSKKTGALNPTIDLSLIGEATIRTPENGLLEVDFPTGNGKKVTLIAFADVGAGGASYRSWIRVKGDLTQLEYVKGGAPVWASNRIAVASNEKGELLPMGTGGDTISTNPAGGVPVGDDDGQNPLGWILPTVLGVVALGVIGVGGFFLFGKKKKTDKPTE